MDLETTTNDRYVREDWTMFRTLQTISQRSGVEPDLLRRLVAKELTDNALDECGTCRIRVLKSGGFYVEDDGSGIAGGPEQIAELFSVNRPLISSKVKRLPTRGALGNGLRVVAGVVLASGGTLEVTTNGQYLRLAPQELTGKTLVEKMRACKQTGTRIEIKLGDSVPADDDFLHWAQFAIEAAGQEPIYKGNTSAYWYDSDSWFEFLQAVGDRTVRDVLNDVDGCSGQKASKIAEEFLHCPANSMTLAGAEKLMYAIREATGPVAERRFKFLGKSSFGGHYARFRGIWKQKPGRGSIVAELPFTVEAWASPAEEDGVYALVNRTPVTGNLDVERLDKKGHIGIFGCGLNRRFKVGKRPLEITLNIQIPYMPITSDGKQPNLELFLSGIGFVVQKAARQCQRANAMPRRTGSQKSVILDNLDRAIDHASGGGRFRFSLRTLFYSVRHFASLNGQPQPTWGWFCSVITEHEEQLGHDIPGMYRDNRGKTYVPHLGIEIPLGTLTVEKYKHHRWTYNKVLYVEKEGLYEILKSAKWPERHDCLLVTSQGFATRAARDVIDLLGDSDQDLLFFAVHDADAYGTCIYQALQHGTAARPGRRVNIVNLGLEPWQGLEMGLPVEPAEEGEKRKPVGNYVRDKGEQWVEWLQTQRIELNAMTTPQFLALLDACMEQHGHGKLIPPEEIMADYLEEGVRERVREAERERILREANYEQRVEEAVERLRPGMSRAAARLPVRVRSSLKQAPGDSWRKPIDRMAERLTGGDGSPPE